MTPEAQSIARKLEASRRVNRIEYKVRLTPSLAEHIRRHAFERNVPRQTLMRDVLQAWVAVMTDYENPLYDPAETGVGRVMLPPERSPGYLVTLGYTTTPDGALDPSAPQVVTAVPAASRLTAAEATWERRPQGSPSIRELRAMSDDDDDEIERIGLSHLVGLDGVEEDTHE